MSIEITSFEQVSSELDNVLNDVSMLAAKTPDSAAAIAEMRTLSANVTSRMAAIEERLTARETSHMALINQLNDILGQMQVKLQGALELKPEIMPYDNALAAGYVDEPTGIKLRADATAQRKFTGQLAVATAAIVFGGAPGTMPMDIWDFDGKPRQLPFNEYLGLVIRLSQWIGAIEARF